MALPHHQCNKNRALISCRSGILEEYVKTHVEMKTTGLGRCGQMEWWKSWNSASAMDGTALTSGVIRRASQNLTTGSYSAPIVRSFIQPFLLGDMYSSYLSPSSRDGLLSARVIIREGQSRPPVKTFWYHRPCIPQPIYSHYPQVLPTWSWEVWSIHQAP